jgi:hypothetical protein
MIVQLFGKTIYNKQSQKFKDEESARNGASLPLHFEFFHHFQNQRKKLKIMKMSTSFKVRTLQ